jgi:hypothetical protein
LVAEFLNGSQVDRAVLSRLLRISELEVEDDFAVDFFLITSERCGRKLQNSLASKPVPNLLPGGRRYMMRFGYLC